MSVEDSVAIVHNFWAQVWNAHDASGADRFVVDDFVIVSGGETISGRENFKQWIEAFLEKVHDLHLEVIETFQNSDGSRVASRFWLTGKNNGALGTTPDQRDIALTATAVWAVREDGKLLTNAVERSSWHYVDERATDATGRTPASKA
jgi:ketosteroid isomerase-like protein